MKKEFIEKYTVTKYKITLEPDEWYCKGCRKAYKGSIPNFCPNCGASWSDNFILFEEEVEEYD